MAAVPCIYVLAGTNGAGKSSIGGAMFQRQGSDYFNPDDAASRILSRNPGISQTQANSAAWYQGKRLLERAVAERRDFAFETTLGGKTITSLLDGAMSTGMEVRIWYVGLDSPELHIARVRARVRSGGHDIADAKIRERYDRSRMNLVRLMPALTELLVYDNTRETDPQTGVAPEPRLILHMRRGRIIGSGDPATAPEWTKPILAVAIKLSHPR
jgi:predicted ABC-type ATPase